MRIECFAHNRGTAYVSLCCREGKLGKEGSHSLRLHSQLLQPESGGGGLHTTALLTLSVPLLFGPGPQFVG